MRYLFLVLLLSVSAQAAGLTGPAGAEFSGVNQYVNTLGGLKTQVSNDIVVATQYNEPEYLARLNELKAELNILLPKWQALQAGLNDANNSQP